MANCLYLHDSYITNFFLFHELCCQADSCMVVKRFKVHVDKEKVSDIDNKS